ncbi:uncharacterized protein TRAVEDRAFT_48735 [Trametes versicolor FP-101664 SS1]|uniref:uncharacterized protein n=1 Tax=Trametes versicolor (strain FP-101664) TaxID=717944 RepID=UPI0004621DB9|nr:uncharacterized protein TRAVEDRAFT_48735 [Trametes versicolor FP-101664 SS1]EIW57702.1 hypothetical protein TRAVEDRAFT_48735 [Trametes versicolor FP-101664 SS1]
MLHTARYGSTTVFDNPARDRVRLPRLIPADGVLVPYAEREALGQYWMKDLESGRFRTETYVAHLNLPGGDNVVLLTTTKVLSFWSNKLRLEWELPFTQVQGVTIEDTTPLLTSVTRPCHQNAEHEPERVLRYRSLRRWGLLAPGRSRESSLTNVVKGGAHGS